MGKTVQCRRESHPTAQSPAVVMNWRKKKIIERRNKIMLKEKYINNISGKITRNGPNPKEHTHDRNFHIIEENGLQIA